MKRIGCYAAAVAVFAVMLTALRCTTMNAANTSEVGNPKLSGHLVDGRSGLAAPGATVRLYPVYLNKMAQALGKTASGAPAIDSALTDPAGYYSFDSLEQNVYSIVGEYIDGSDTLTMRHPSVMFITSKDLGYDTLRLPGWIKGKVAVPGGENPKNITCYIPGTSYIAITNDTGGFKITGIPEGTYSLSVTSARFNDTTLFRINVSPNHETDAGYIALGLDRSKNEHDVWGVFDSTYNSKAIDSIEAIVSGDSIPADKPRIYKLDWRPALYGYSGFIYVPDKGFFWKVDIVVFDTLGRRIGLYRVPTINRATGDVQVPTFNPFNSVPVIAMNDTTVSIKDTIRLRPMVTTLTDDSIVSMRWKIEDTGKFTPTVKKDSLIIAPRNPATIPWIFEVTDKFGNIATGTSFISVIIDPPTVDAGNDTIVSINDTIRLHGSGSDVYGKIVKWEWSINGSAFIKTAKSDTAIIAPADSTMNYVCIIRATDDDGNAVEDTVIIKILKDSPVVFAGNDTASAIGSQITLKGTATQQFGIIVKYLWDFNGDGIWDDSSATSSQGTVTYNTPGMKSVIFGARDDDNNLAKDTLNVIVGTFISGTITTDTTFSIAKSPYLVIGNTLIESSCSLSITPGTKVMFLNNSLIEVRGKISAIGTSLDSIVFNNGQVRLNWSGGSTYNGDGTYKAGPRFEYCSFLNSTIFVMVSGCGPYLKDCYVKQISGYVRGMYVTNCGIDNLGSYSDSNSITNSHIKSLTVDGYANFGPVSITNCEFDTLIIDRWNPLNVLEYNIIRYLEWSRPSTSETSFLHNNNILGTGAGFVFNISSASDGTASIDATNNYWGSLTNEIQEKGNNANISGFWDYYDDFSLVKIDYSSWHAAPIANAGPNW